MRGRVTRARRTSPALRGFLLAAVAAIVLVAGSAARGAVDIEELQPALPDLDTRTQTVPPSAAQVAAAQQLHADVTWNQFGTPASVYNLDGNLATGIAAPDAVAAVRTWLGQNGTLFRLPSANDLTLVKDTPLVGGDGHAVLLGQSFDGVLAAPDGLVTVAVTGSGGAWNVTYASSTLTATDAVAGDATLSPEQAWVHAANAVGQPVSTDDVTVSGTSDGWTELTVTGFDDPQAVRESAFPVPGQAARPAFQTVVADGADVGYVQTVDAGSGQILARTNIVDNAADNPTWKTFPAFPITTPLNRFPWGYPTADIRQTFCFAATADCSLVVGNSANSANTPLAWDQTDPTLPSSFTTSGNDASDREQWITASNNPPRAAGTLFQPTSPTRDYAFPWTNAWFTSGCNPAQLGTLAAPNTGTGADISAATANLFVLHSRMHDWAYYLGFTESAWNGQANNFATPAPFRGNDPVTGNAQSGGITGGFPGFGGRDNANMGTRPDGTPSVTNMFLWQPIAGSFYAPCVDGDYDMSVVGHEYGHMIENRMIGKGNVRQGNHAGAMGEAFGDLNAAEYLNENHFGQNGIDPFVVGPYVTGNTVNGIRNVTMDWPMSGPFPSPGRDPHVDSLNLGDYSYDIPGQEVHSDGEMWVAVNFTLRQLLLNRYPAHGASLDRACANGQVPVNQCPGDRPWFQLYYDAMLLMPTRPTLLDARNAILAADQTRFGGANQDILWRAFAERGFGQFASTTLPAGNDNDPIPDFSSPDENNATVTFKAVVKDGSTRGAPVNAKIYVGDYEARVTQIADTDPTNDVATPNSNLDAAAMFVPVADHRGDGHNDHGGRNDHGRGRDDDNHDRKGDDNGAGYNFVANAPGYGHVRFRIDALRPGEARTVTIEFPTNFASSAKGATATGDGTNLANLLDDTEGTNWTSTANAPVQGQQVTIALGGGRQTFTAVNVSALLVPGQNRFTALRQFALDACDAGRDAANPTCDGSIEAGWRPVMISRPDAFPSVNPRPVAPDMLLRTWDVPRTTATHVRFRVLNNQCTGQTSYQGEQDNDPQFSTDCRVTSLTSTGQVALPARNTEVHAAEVQVLSSLPNVRGAEDDIGRHHDDRD